MMSVQRWPVKVADGSKWQQPCRGLLTAPKVTGGWAPQGPETPTGPKSPLVWRGNFALRRPKWKLTGQLQRLSPANLQGIVYTCNLSEIIEAESQVRDIHWQSFLYMNRFRNKTRVGLERSGLMGWAR